MGFDIVIHSDWGMPLNKRWSVSAEICGTHWRVDGPCRAHTSERLLNLARNHRVLAGFDFPIGVPAWWGKRTGFSGFTAMLGELGKGKWSDFYKVAETPSEISLERPFYPNKPGGKKREHLWRAHGLDNWEGLLRQCESASSGIRAACPLFWTLGGNQVGKGALAGWRDIIIPCREAQARVWPFDTNGELVPKKNGLTIVETYPTRAYGVVDFQRPPKWGKGQREDRKKISGAIRQWANGANVIFSTKLGNSIDNGFPDGDDHLDALLGLCIMLEVIDGRLAHAAPQNSDIRRWEGWIFGRPFEF